MTDTGLTILIVDDSPEDRELMRRLLKAGSSRSDEFLEAESAEAGLCICLDSKTGPPDCILLDYFLPDSTAPDFLAALGGPDFPCCPVVIVTGFSGGVDGPSVLRLGAQDLIGKDWMNPQSLTRSVDNAIERYSIVHSLREKEHLLSESQRIAQIGSWIYQLDGKITWSEEAYRIWGVSPDRFTPTVEALEGLIYAEDRPAMRAWIAACIAGETPAELVFRRVLPNGSLRHLRGQGELYHDSSGAVIYMTGTVQDITHQKMAELKLIESEERLRLALEAAQMGIFDWDILINRIVWSRHHEELWGFGPGEFGGSYQDFADRVHPDDLPGVNEAIAHCIATGEHYRKEFRVVWPDGSLRWVIGLGKSTMGANGKALRMRGTVKDITEQKQAELALCETESLRLAYRHLRNLLETSLDPLMIIDLEGTLTDINAATETMTGKARDELIGTDFTCHFSEPDIAKAGFQQVLHRGALRDYALEFRHRDGHPTPCSFNAAVYRNQTGEVAGVFAAARDISAQRALEEQLRDAKRSAESANLTKSAFLANMSHEIRTPMNAIIGLSALLLDTDLSPHQRDYLDKVLSASQSLLGIINDILDYSRIESGNLPIEKAAFRLKEVIKAVNNLFALRLEEKGLKLIIDLDADLPKCLVGDSLRLGQVITNLMGNAVKFTQQGEIRVQVGMLPPNTGQNQTVTLRFNIADTGIGIAPEHIANLFAPFSQADMSITRRFGGSGLGLSIAKRLVQLMGGEISATSHLGRGSTFTFTVSLGLADQDAERGFAETAIAGKREGADHLVRMSTPIHGAEILLVEDNPLSQKVAAELLKKMKFNVTLAESGEKAVAWAQQKKFDAILMDLQLPVIDGFEATRQIRAMPDGRNLPIIALTASAMQQDRQACLEAGMSEHISKPIDPAVLISSLLRLIQARCPQVGELGKPVEEGDPAASPEWAIVDGGQLGPLLDELEQLLSHNLIKAEKVVGQIEHLLTGTRLSHDFQRVCRLTRQMRFKEALDALRLFTHHRHGGRYDDVC